MAVEDDTVAEMSAVETEPIASYGKTIEFIGEGQPTMNVGMRPDGTVIETMPRVPARNPYIAAEMTSRGAIDQTAKSAPRISPFDPVGLIVPRPCFPAAAFYQIVGRNA